MTNVVFRFTFNQERAIGIHDISSKHYNGQQGNCDYGGTQRWPSILLKSIFLFFQVQSAHVCLQYLFASMSPITVDCAPSSCHEQWDFPSQKYWVKLCEILFLVTKNMCIPFIYSLSYTTDTRLFSHKCVLYCLENKFHYHCILRLVG